MRAITTITADADTQPTRHRRNRPSRAVQRAEAIRESAGLRRYRTAA